MSVSSTPQDFDQDQWKVAYSQGSITNSALGKKFKIDLIDQAMTAGVDKSTMVQLLDKIANETFHRAEFHTDGKLYLYTDDLHPKVCDVAQKAGEATTHSAIFQITASKAYPMEMIESAKQLSADGLDRYTVLVKSVQKNVCRIKEAVITMMENEEYAYLANSIAGQAIHIMKPLDQILGQDKEIIEHLLASLGDTENKLNKPEDLTPAQCLECLVILDTFFTQFVDVLKGVKANEELAALPLGRSVPKFVQNLTPIELIHFKMQILSLNRSLKKEMKLAEERQAMVGTIDALERLHDELFELLEEFYAQKIIAVYTEDRTMELKRLFIPGLILILLSEMKVKNISNLGEWESAFKRFMLYYQQLIDFTQAMYDEAQLRHSQFQPSLDTGPSCQAILRELSQAVDLKQLIALHKALIQSTNVLLCEGSCVEGFSARAEAANGLKVKESHPLYSMDGAIKKQTPEGPLSAYGAYFSGYRTKGGYVHAFRRNINGKVMNCFDFFISTLEREALDMNLVAIRIGIFWLNHHLPKDLCKGVKIKVIPQVFKADEGNGVFSEKNGWDSGASAVEIEFERLGKVIIGNTKGCVTLHNWINVEMNADLPLGEGILKLNQILVLLGLGPLLLDQDPETEEKIKIADLTRAYFPKIMVELDKTGETYRCSPEELIAKICAKEAAMRGIFQTQLSQMQKVEAFPGQTVFAIPGFSEKLKKAGGWGLIAGIGEGKPFDSVCKYVIKRLLETTPSTLNRLQSGWVTAGTSVKDDVESGGACQVFLLMVAKVLRGVPIDDYPFSGEFQLLYDMSILDRGGYAYTEDRFGSKEPKKLSYHKPDHLFYEGREDLITFIGRLSHANASNEVMVKGVFGILKSRTNAV
jgi:hypothetical protein